MVVLDVLSWIFLLTGGALSIIAGIGLVRLPDIYARSHAAGIGDTLGSAMVVLGLILQAPDWMVASKLALVIVFLWLTSPVASHALVKATYAHGVKIECEEEDAVSR